MKESFLNDIDGIVSYYQNKNIGSHINWDTLAASLSSLEKDQLAYALNILGLSGHERYIPLLEEYAHNSDPEVRTWALEALEEVKSRL